MIRVILLFALASLCRAQEPILIFDPLPEPLRLPAGLTETLPLDKTGSYFGDAIRVVDCWGSDVPDGDRGSRSGR